MKVLATLAIAALAACRSEPPDATGRLDRPAGLAIVARGSEQGETREDLLVADSEAEGVKIVQRLSSGANFVHAPVVFFPLVVPAPHFPTEIAASLQQKDSDDNPIPVDRAYVLSSGNSALNLIDITPLAYGSGPGSAEGTNTLIRSIDLSMFGAGLIPTDVAVVQSLGETDLVAVSLEGITDSDQLWLMKIDRMGEELVASSTLAASPRGIAVRGTMTTTISVLASSATDFITEVQIATSSTAIAPIVTAVRTIDVSGPTHEVVDAKSFGAFAIRSDRPRVVHLVPGPSGLARANVRDDSPFTPIPERDTPETRGTLDTHQSPIGAAVLGFLNPSADIAVDPAPDPDNNSLESLLVDPDPRATVSAYTGFEEDPNISMFPRYFYRQDGPMPVMILAHADGRVSFVVVESNTASIATSLDSSVLRVSTSSEITVEAIDPDAGNAVIGACEGTNLCPMGGPNAADCPAEIVRHEIPNYALYRATYRGALVMSMTPQIMATGETTYRISEPNLLSYEERMVMPGDLVRLQLQSTNCENLEMPNETIATGTVTAVANSELDVDFGVPLMLDVKCEGVDSLPLLSRVYEVYPAGEEMVLVRRIGTTILEVVAREPVDTSTGSSVVFTDRLAMKLSSPVPFSCDEGAGFATCAIDTECGPGRTCVDMDEVAGCVQTCETSCAMGAPSSCIRGLIGRRCTTVDFDVLPTIPFVVSAALFDGNSSFPAVAPAGAAFSDARQAFVISYSGSRRLVEIMPETFTNTIRHIR